MVVGIAGWEKRGGMLVVGIAGWMGDGGLDWAQGRPLIEVAMAPLADVEVLIFGPVPGAWPGVVASTEGMTDDR